MKRTTKQEENIRKSTERTKPSKESTLLTDAEFAVDQAFENGDFDLEDRKKLTEIKNELYNMWRKHQ